MVEQQGDRFVGWAIEDGGRPSEELIDAVDEACASMGGTRGEQQALLRYWRSRIAITNARGVAKVIKARVPFCAGDHLHAQPHHFGHLHQVAPPLQPRQHLPTRGDRRRPGTAPQPAATHGRGPSPLPSPLAPNAGVVTGRASG